MSEVLGVSFHTRHPGRSSTDFSCSKNQVPIAGLWPVDFVAAEGDRLGEFAGRGQVMWERGTELGL